MTEETAKTLIRTMNDLIAALRDASRDIGMTPTRGLVENTKELDPTDRNARLPLWAFESPLSGI